MIRIVMALLVGLGTLLSPPLAPSPALAVDAAADGKRRINLAGRQRMLSQRMAKAACFAGLGLDAEAHLAMMGEAHDLFDTTLRALQAGDREQGLLPETDTRILAGLARVGGLWADYAAAIRAARADGIVTPGQLAVIARLNLPVLAEMNRTVGLTERTYGSRSVPLGLAIALNVSGRQRMLTQKMSKELCLIGHGLEPEANRKALAETVAVFEASLDALVNGAPDVGIMPPRGADLRARLAEVQALWRPLAPIFAAVAEGQVPGPVALVTVARDNNRLLATMNEAVFLYERE